MRLLSLFAATALVGVGVDAACTGNTVSLTDFTPDGSGTPSALAVPFFWTRTQHGGDFTDPFTDGGAGGLTGADNYCQYTAAGSATTATTLVKSRSTLFKAVMSNGLTNAIDRFANVGSLSNTATAHDVTDSNNNCIADSVWSLFNSGYNLNQKLPDETGAFALSTATILLFTATTASGLKFFTDTSNMANYNGAYCGSGSSTTDQGWHSLNPGTSPSPEIGRIYEPASNFQTFWLDAQTTSGCGNGNHILCLQASPTPTSPGAAGDPQFTGLQGQSFQVHGMPDEFFNLISLPDMQLNSRFTYLASGRCNYNNTECWTHPGTYVDQLGFMFPGLQIKAIAGPHQDGMSVFINDKRLMASADAAIQHHTIRGHAHGVNETQVISVQFAQQDQLVVKAPLFTITATNSDMFFNFGVSLHSPSLLSAGSPLHHLKASSNSNSPYPAFPLHGLLGQTWKNARYTHGRMYQGSVDDYMLLDSKLLSTKFVFNQYKH